MATWKKRAFDGDSWTRDLGGYAWTIAENRDRFYVYREAKYVGDFRTLAEAKSVAEQGARAANPGVAPVSSALLARRLKF